MLTYCDWYHLWCFNFQKAISACDHNESCKFVLQVILMAKCKTGNSVLAMELPQSCAKPLIMTRFMSNVWRHCDWYVIINAWNIGSVLYFIGFPNLWGTSQVQWFLTAHCHLVSGLILSLLPANEKRRYWVAHICVSKPALFQTMACCLTDAKPLSEPMLEFC